MQVLYVMGILLAILAGLFAVIALLSFCGSKYNADASRRVEGWRFTIFCVNMILGCAICFSINGTCAKSDETELAVKAIQENADEWTFFLDGVEVMYDNIDIYQYYI